MQPKPAKSAPSNRAAYIVTNDDGSNHALLADLPTMATYLLTYGTERTIIATECQNWPIWTATKTKRGQPLKLDSTYALLRDRRTAMQRAGICDPTRQRHHNENIFAGCLPAG